MQPIPSVVPQLPSLQGMTPGQGQPETGGFDFMNYLLGLQGSPSPQSPTSPLSAESSQGMLNVLPEILPAPGSAMPAKEPTDKSRDPLQALFAAVPMPGMNPLPIADLTPVPTPKGEGDPMQMEGAKPQWNQSALTQTADFTPSPVNQLKGQPGKSEDTGVALEGFESFESAAEQEGIELSISRPGQAMAAKVYSANAAQPESVAKNDSDIDVKAREALVVRPELAERESSDVSTRAAVQAVSSEEKPETASLKKGASAARAEKVDFSPVSTPAHKVESAASPAPAESAQAPNTVSVPEVVKRVETLVQNGGGEMTLALDPPDLGKIEVKVKTQGNRVEIEMRSESVQAKSALDSHLGELKSAMQSQDLHLAKLDVQVQRDPASFGGHSFAGMSDGKAGNAHGGPNQGQGRHSPETNRRFASQMSVPQVTRSMSPIAGQGRVDLRI
jgi:hypothetical protein